MADSGQMMAVKVLSEQEVVEEVAELLLERLSPAKTDLCGCGVRADDEGRRTKDEKLSLEEQEVLLEVARRRLFERRRVELAQEVAQAREAYRLGHVRRGTVQDLMARRSNESPGLGGTGSAQTRKSMRRSRCGQRC